MLRIRADVNGHVVGWLYIHNTDRTRNPGTYDAAIQTEHDIILGIEGITHAYRLPWWELVSNIARRIHEAALAQRNQWAGRFEGFR